MIVSVTMTDTDAIVAILNNPNHGLTVVRGPANEVRILAATLAARLGYPRTDRLLALVKPDEHGSMEVRTPAGKRTAFYVTLPGLFRALGARPLSRITDPEMHDMVDRFQDWIYRDVVPSIAETGQYLTPERRMQTALVDHRLHQYLERQYKLADGATDRQLGTRIRQIADGIAFSISDQYLRAVAGVDAVRQVAADPARASREAYPTDEPPPVTMTIDASEETPHGES